MKKNITTLELVTADTGLSQEQLKLGMEYQAKFPNIVAAYKKVREQENNLKGKWLHLCQLLRKPATGTMLNAKEMSILLRSLGENRARTSEIIRVVSVDDKVWKQYEENLIGFKAVLRLARDESADESPSADSPETPQSNDKPEARKTSIHVVPDVVKRGVADLLSGNGFECGNALPPVGKGYYQMTYQFKVNGVQRNILVSFEVDDTTETKG